MSHNHLPPSPFGTGTQYDGAGNKHIVSPESQAERSVDLPRISRVIGGKVAEATVQIPPRISRIAAEAPAPSQQSETDVQYTVATDLHSPTRDSYAGPASRQMALDDAEAKNRLNPNRKTYQ